MAYIKQEKIENAKAEIVDRMQVFINEYKQYSESTVDYHYGRVDGLEVAKRLVKSILTDLTEQATADVVEVKHGEWELKSEIHRFLEEVDEDFYVECPFCQRVYYVPFEFENEKMLKYAKENYPYCNCGAKMDKGNAQ